MGGGGRGRKGVVFLDKSVLLWPVTQGVSFWKQRLQEGVVVARSVDGVVYERATFPFGHSCSELLFSF